MPRKRSAKEAFTAEISTAPGSVQNDAPLSAFAAAKARAAGQNAVQITAIATDLDTDDESNTSFVPDLRDPASLLDGVVDWTAQRSADAASDDGAESGLEAADGDALLSAARSTSSKPVTPIDRQLSILTANSTQKTDNGDQVTLNKSDRLVAIGCYDLDIVQGAVSVCGALLRPDQSIRRIWAPASHALPCVVAKTDAVVRLLHVNNELASFDDLSPLWGRLWTGKSEAKCSFAILQHSSDDVLSRSLTAIENQPETDKSLEEIVSSNQANSSILIIGPKGCGKSTLCRTMVNKFLTAPSPLNRSSCFWLDLDPGQPEFSPPGQVSLVQIRDPVLGPPFTHSVTHPASSFRAIRSHAIAALSPREDLDHFKACVSDLVQAWKHARIDFPRAPLVVNSSGWVTGAGLDVLTHTLQQARPTDIIMAGGLDPIGLQAIDQVKTVGSKIWSIPSVRASRNSAANPRSAAELRQMQSMSYFHSTESAQSWISKPIDTFKPWRVRYRGLNPGILGILSYHEAIPPGMAATVLIGMTAALVSVQPSEAARTLAVCGQTDRASSGLPLLQPNGPGVCSPPLDPSMSECLGQVLIRGIDTRRGELEILTPVPSAVLKSHHQGLNHDNEDELDSDGPSLFLVRGKVDSPDWAFMEDLHYQAASGSGDVKSRITAALIQAQVDRPYVGVRRADAGLSDGVWRVRHLPRRDQ